MKSSLRKIAIARSGDKGSSANVGVIALNDHAYLFLKEHLTAEKVHSYFLPLGVKETVRYELPTLGALNFILKGILGEGGSLSLRSDAQGKALGQALLLMEMDLPPELVRER